jgi:hypothetical protein
MSRCHGGGCEAQDSSSRGFLDTQAPHSAPLRAIAEHPSHDNGILTPFDGAVLGFRWIVHRVASHCARMRGLNPSRLNSTVTLRSGRNSSELFVPEAQIM